MHLKQVFHAGRPHTARFELSNRCNLRCKMCGIWEERPNVDFHPDLFIEILESQTMRALRVISLTGGEPFAMKDLGQFYTVARQKHPSAHINISTNGWYTKETLSFLHEVQARNTSITISFDGVESHDSIRRVEGSAKRLLATAALVRSDFPQISLSLKMTVSSENSHEILATARLCKEMGIPFRMKTLEKLVCHQGRFPSELQGPDYGESDGDQISEQAREVLRLNIETNRKYISNMIRMLDGEQLSNCGCSPRTIFIGIDGKVFLCRRKTSIGNVHQTSLDNIWASTAHEDMRQQMKNCQDSELSLSYANN